MMLLLLLFLLKYPREGVQAAASGLLLWYRNLLPALLPFTILSNLFLTSGYLDDLLSLLSPMLRRVLGRHIQAAYPIAAGFLFGFPLGSKITADLRRQKKLTLGEANVLCAMCNNISPAFVSSYLLMDSLGLFHAVGITYVILYLPPLLSGLYLLKGQKAAVIHKKTASSSNLNFQILDAGIMNGFETLLKLGGYVMLFSLVVQLLAKLFGPHQRLWLFLTGITELTNGIHVLSSSGLANEIMYPAAMAMTAFGGISGFAQTASMCKDTDISMHFYLRFKLWQTAVTTLCAFLAAGSLQ